MSMTPENMQRFTTTSKMRTVKTTSSSSTDQPVSMRMDHATSQAPLPRRDAEKFKPGNGLTTTIHWTLMPLVFCHQPTEELLIMVMLRRSSYGLILEISDKLLLSKFMVQTNKLPLKLWLRPQLTKFHSLLTFNLPTQVTGSNQVKMILTDAAKSKLGNFHSVSTETRKLIPQLRSSLLTWLKSTSLVLPSPWQWDHGAHHSHSENGPKKNSLLSPAISRRLDRIPSVVTLMVSIGIGKDIAQRFASKVTANAVGMTKSVVPNLQRN